MDGAELTQLIGQRLSILRSLREVARRQVEAIGEGRLSDLMRLLSEKQKPLSQLSAIAKKLRVAVDDDPESRVWDSEAQRATCSRQQEECETLHLELLAMEAECETALQESRSSIQQQLDRVDAGRQAVDGYAASHQVSTSGGRLDLSSD